MSSRLFLIFVLILAIPMALLGGAGWLLFKQDQIAANSQLEASNRAQLQSIETQLNDQFSDYAAELAAVSQLLATDTDSLRYVARRHPFIRQVVLLQADGQRLHPPTNEAMSGDERALLQRAASVFNGGLLAESKLRVANNGLAQPVSNRVVYDNVLKSPESRYEAIYAYTNELSNETSTIASNSRERSEKNVSQIQAVTQADFTGDVGAELEADAAPAMPAGNSSEAYGDELAAAPSFARTAAEPLQEYRPSTRAKNEQNSRLEEWRANIESNNNQGNNFDRGGNNDLAEPPSERRMAANVARNTRSDIAPVANTATVTASGWYSWHHDRELHHMYWQRLANNRLLAFEVESARVKADLIARLPSTPLMPAKIDAQAVGSELTTQPFNDGIRLVDAHGRTVYQWGRYFLDATADSKADSEAAPDLIHALTPPLSAWRLEYFRGSKPSTYARYFFVLIIVAGALLLLLLLAGYFWREQQRAANLAQQRVSFVNQVSHELKTPLTNVRMYAEMAADSQPEDNPTRSYLDVIVTESQRLSRLITNVLNFARTQREQLVLHQRELVPDDVIQQVLDNFAPSLADHGLALTTDLQAKQTVALDADILEQILNNLLGNVEKYAADGKRVRVASQLLEHGQLLELSVRDYGSGISKADQKRIFEPFYRVSNKLTDGVSGTGIGLSIARQLAVLHGGDLALKPVQDSIDEPQGCWFVVTLVVGKN